MRAAFEPLDEDRLMVVGVAVAGFAGSSILSSSPTDAAHLMQRGGPILA